MSRYIQTYFDNGQASVYYKYTEHPLLPLILALEPLLGSIDRLYEQIDESKYVCSISPKQDLSIDESAAIYLYTNEVPEPTLSSALNQALRSRIESMIKPWFGFLQLFNTALKKLPAIEGTVWRGIHIDLAKQMRENENFVWACVSSCSTSVHLIKSYGDHNTALCSINITEGKHIYQHSKSSDEDEILLLPGTRLRVKKSGYDVSIRRYVVHLVQICNANHNKSLPTDSIAPQSTKLLGSHPSKCFCCSPKKNGSYCQYLLLIFVTFSIVKYCYARG